RPRPALPRRAVRVDHDLQRPHPFQERVDAAGVQGPALMRYEPADFHRGLVEHGYVIPSGVNGVWARGSAFEDIVQAFDGFVMREAKDDGAQVLMYPPVLPREVIEKVG